MKKFNMKRYFELVSALQKSIRWCDVNDSRYFARELMDMGKPGAVLNRLMIIAAEDVGLADPSLIVYLRRCSDSFEEWIKQNKIKKSEAIKYQVLCKIVDRAVIAAAISYKSRLLPMCCFSTLFDIYQKEDFNGSLSKYLNQFSVALIKGNEKEALYYAFVVCLFLNAKDKILTEIKKHSAMRNQHLIHLWSEEYKRYNELLVLTGSVILLCRELNYTHGEYNDTISQYLNVPATKAKIPDRAYDKHTIEGKKMGRSFDHFFNVAASVKNERFPNDWEQSGKTAYFNANKKGLGKTAKVIKEIKEKYEKCKKAKKHEEIYNQATV